MVNPWLKLKNEIKRKRQALLSIVAGLALFCFFLLWNCIFHLPLCPINYFLGICCPGCGMTRGFFAILRLDFYAAFHYHVLSIPLFAGIVLYVAICTTDVLFSRSDLDRLEQFCTKKSSLVLFLIIFLVATYFQYQLNVPSLVH